ncbi:hypothetical protein BHM03_00030425 [Ensete ventricosum]|nr:hypothetical protein BHM03_00030425 [Ensete ventricosum]
MTFCPIPSLHCAPTTATSVFVPPRILATFDTSPAEKKKKLIGFTPQGGARICEWLLTTTSPLSLSRLRRGLLRVIDDQPQRPNHHHEQRQPE